MSRPRPIEDFYLAADGNDWAPALLRAQSTVTGTATLNEPLTLLFKSRRYTFNSIAHIFRRTNLIGENSQGFVSVSKMTDISSYNFAQLYFPNTSGIEVHAVGTYSGDATATAQCVHLENLIIGGAGHTSGVSRHGIIGHSSITARNVSVCAFGGAGVLNHCSTGVNTNLPYKGNANNSYFEYCRFQRNGTVGTMLDGGDTNCTYFEKCYWDDNGDYYASGAITAATASVYVKAASRAIVSSSITSNVLTMNMGVAQATHGYVIGDYIATTGMSANVTGVQVTGISGNNVICAITAADNATNGAGTLFPTDSGNGEKIVTVVLNTASDITKFDRGSVIQVTLTSLGRPYSSPGCRVLLIYNGVSAGNPSTITFIGDTSLTEGVQLNGVGTVTGYPVQVFDSCNISNTYVRPFLGTNLNGGSGFFMPDDSSYNVIIHPYSEGASADVFYESKSLIIHGSLDPSGTLSSANPSTTLIKSDSANLEVYQAVKTYNRYPGTSSAGTVTTQIGSGAQPAQAFLATDITSNAKLYLFYSLATAADTAGGWWEWTKNTGSTGAILRMATSENTRGDAGNLWLPANGAAATNSNGTSTNAGGGIYFSNFNSLDNGTASYIKQSVIGSQCAFMKCIGETYIVSGCTVGTGVATKVTIPTHKIHNGERVLVQGVAGVTTAQVNGMWIVENRTTTTIDLNGSTFGGTYTASTGRVLRLRAETYLMSTPRDGTWAIGDIVWNKDPLTSSISGWICTVAGTPGTWVPMSLLQYTNGSQQAQLVPTSVNFPITSAASDGGGTPEIRLTTATHGLLDGQRVLVSGVTSSAATVNGIWIIKDKTGTTIDLTGSTHSGTYTASTGCLIAARATTHTNAAPADGTWAVGDIAYDLVPVSGAQMGWACTVAGTPGTWVALANLA